MRNEVADWTLLLRQTDQFDLEYVNKPLELKTTYKSTYYYTKAPL